MWRIKNFLNEFKWSIQRIYRKNNCADADLWSLDFCLAKIILKKLRAFREHKLYGHPCDFCTWEDLKNTGQYKNKKKYLTAIKNGKIMGGGFNKWIETIDKMIFAFEFILSEQGYKKEKAKFVIKYGDWEEKIEKNKQESHIFKKPYIYYFNENMYNEFNMRTDEGLNLFAKYFQNLWS
jgi:hypothetical protein